MDALSTGAISWTHARIIADETQGLGPTAAAALVAHVLDPNPARGAAAGELVPSRFRSRIRSWRERHHPESLEKRHTKSAADRRMECTPDRDGMAWLSLYIPAHQASAIWNRSTALARGLQNPDEPRTITQLRPDIAAGLVLSAGPALTHAETSTGQHNPGAGNDVTTGDGDQDAIGQASMARKLVANGANSFYRVLIDPKDGAPLEIGRTNYRLTKARKKALQLRDGKCTFPGCNNPSPDNEADHLQAWHHGGTTGISNLAQLCPKHHHLKHNSGWKPTPATQNEPPGWTSPTGRHYKAEQPDQEPPQWPPGYLPTGEKPGLLPDAPETPGPLTATNHPRSGQPKRASSKLPSWPCYRARAAGSGCIGLHSTPDGCTW
jgi:hypothetical protein